MRSSKSRYIPIRQKLPKGTGEPPGLDPQIVQARRAMKDRALQLHREGLTLPEICIKCGICEDTLSMWRREDGVVRPHAPKGQSRLLQYKDDLHRAWYSEETLEMIAQRYGTSPSRLSIFAKAQGWPQRKQRPAMAKLPVKRTHLHMDEIRAWWDEGVSANDIGRRIGVTGAAISDLARRHNWPSRPSPRIEKEELVYQGLKAGLSVRAMAATFQLSRSSIQHILNDGGLPDDV